MQWARPGGAATALSKASVRPAFHPAGLDPDATMRPMKKFRLADVIRKIDQILLVIVVLCFTLGGAAWLYNSVRLGMLLEPSGPNY